MNDSNMNERVATLLSFAKGFLDWVIRFLQRSRTFYRGKVHPHLKSNSQKLDALVALKITSPVARGMLFGSVLILILVLCGWFISAAFHSLGGATADTVAASVVTVKSAPSQEVPQSTVQTTPISAKPTSNRTWKGLTSTLDPEITMGGEANHPSGWKAVAAAPDETLVLVGQGTDNEHLNDVYLCIRIRDLQEKSTIARMREAFRATSYMTNSTIPVADFTDQLLAVATNEKKLPIDAAGWVISFSTFESGGYIDRKPELGKAIIIEFKAK